MQNVPSAPPAPPVPEPAVGCEPENRFFRRDLPVTAGGGAWWPPATCAGGKQEVTSGAEPASERRRGPWQWSGGWRGHRSESAFLSFGAFGRAGGPGSRQDQSVGLGRAARSLAGSAPRERRGWRGPGGFGRWRRGSRAPAARPRRAGGAGLPCLPWTVVLQGPLHAALHRGRRGPCSPGGVRGRWSSCSVSPPPGGGGGGGASAAPRELDWESG